MIGRRASPSTEQADKPKGFDDFELRLGDVMRGERATLAKSLLDVQRELKIKASYIAAIENAEVSSVPEAPATLIHHSTIVATRIVRSRMAKWRNTPAFYAPGAGRQGSAQAPRSSSRLMMMRCTSDVPS